VHQLDNKVFDITEARCNHADHFVSLLRCHSLLVLKIMTSNDKGVGLTSHHTCIINPKHTYTLHWKLQLFVTPISL